MSDALTNDMRKQLQELQQQYEQSLIDSDTLSDLLSMLVEEELSKPDTEINTAWLNACTDLMADIDREKTQFQLDRMEESKRELHSRLSTKKATVWRGILVAACLVLAVGIAFAFAPFRHGMNDSIMENAIAGDKRDGLVAPTFEPDRISVFLGFMPPIPEWLPDGWKYSGYQAFDEASRQSVILTYDKDGETSSLVYTYMRTDNTPELIGDNRQQIILENGTVVDLYRENGMITASWANDQEAFFVAGSISEDDLFQMIQRIH